MSLAAIATFASAAGLETGSADMPPVTWRAIIPTLILIGGAAGLLVASAMVRRHPTSGVYSLATVATAVAAIIAAVPLWQEVTDPDEGPFSALAGALMVDGFAIFMTVVICAAVVLGALLSQGWLQREGQVGPEPYVMMLLSASGGVVMASANDLLVMFLGLEILSIPVYVLAAMHLRRARSQEAGMKYFVLGAFSSAFFLYGIAMVYGATGSTNLGAISTFAAPLGTVPGTVDPALITSGPPAILLAGFGLLLVGFGFKIAAVPFHSWTPDVYEGSPTPFVAYMASGVKAAAFAGLLRVFVVAFESYADDWQPYVYVLAVATLLVGSVLAVVQTDVKRMLAYSSISHAGFILLGVQAATQDGISAALFYLAAYTFMVAGSFGVVAVISRRGDDHTNLADFGGLSRREPLLAFVFTVFLLAQAGVPLTSGFFAKFEVLAAAIDADSWPLAICAMVSAVVAAFVYLRIVVAMYMSDEADESAAAAPLLRIPPAATIAIGVAFIFTLVVGFLPDSLTETSEDATAVVVATER